MTLKNPLILRMNKLKLSPAAQKDLQEIKIYISGELQNPAAAGNVLSRITKKLRSLMEYPHMGAPLDSITEGYSDYRFLLCGNYTAFYRIEGNMVYVVRILYGRRDFMRVLFGNTPENKTDSPDIN